MAKPSSFWHELKRRNVLRAGVLYAASAWLLVQIATQVFPFFHVPEWIVRWIVVACVIGAPFWLALAWFYELTPDGLKRETEVAPHESIARMTGRKLDYAIIAVLAIIVIVLAANALVWRKGPGLQPDNMNIAAAFAKIPQKSVAVLPFVNDSGDPKQRYFSDGLSGDLITALSQFVGLKVISRESAFRFRDKADSSARIGATLGVAHLLEGSVQRIGGEVRVTATLVNAADGSALWSHNYDRPYADLFALQDDITRNVADALKAKLLQPETAASQTERPPSGSLAAWSAYQQGNFFQERGTKADFHTAIGNYEEAIRVDPRYAQAYAQMAWTWTRLAAGYLGGTQLEEAYAQARSAVDKALALDPDLAAAHRAHGLLLAWADFDQAGAEAEYRRALQLAPDSPVMKAGVAIQLANLGKLDDAVSLLRQALTDNPLNAEWYYYLANYLTALGHLDAAQAAAQKAIALQPTSDGLRSQLVLVYVLRGDARAALATAEQEPPGYWRDFEVALARQIGPDRAAADASLRTLITSEGGTGAYQIADVYALRNDPDHMFKWLDRAWAVRDPGIASLLYDPLILRYRGDSRFSAFCKQVGLPAPGAVAIPASTAATTQD
jgi:TolB-like protein/Flp pilus assembly protein TadD